MRSSVLLRGTLLLDLLLIRVNRLYLPNPQHMVLSTRGHELAVSPEFDHPDSAVIVLQFDRLLQR